jgi:Fe(3+) dicitrate transport protein
MGHRFLKPHISRSARRVVTAALLAVGVGAGGEGLAAQARTALIDGVVNGENVGALEGARVELLELERRVLTDTNGRFTIRDLPAGRYTLRIVMLGWKTMEAELDVEESVIRISPITLEPEAIELSSLTVVEQRTRLSGASVDIPGVLQVLDAKTLESTASAHDDVHQFLRRLPGVNVQEEDGFGLRPNIGMRGSGSERSSKITVMEDGVLIAPAPYAAPAAYYFPVAGRMSAIEVRKGSSQIKYGPRTIGGVLNLVSSPIPTRFEWDVEGALGSANTGRLRARAGGASNHVGWLAETYQLGSGGFKEIEGGGPTGFRIQDYLGKLRLNSDPTSSAFYQQIEFKVGVFDERSHETYLGLTDADFALHPLLRYTGSREDLMRVEQTQISARHFLRLGRILDVTTTAYRNDVWRNWYKLQSVRGTNISSILAEPDAFGEELAIVRGGERE